MGDEIYNDVSHIPNIDMKICLLVAFSLENCVFRRIQIRFLLEESTKRIVASE